MSNSEKTPLLQNDKPTVDNISINVDNLAKITPPKGVKVENSVKLQNIKQELDNLQQDIESVRNIRLHTYSWYKWGHRFFKTLVTIITAAAMVVNIVDVDENIRDYVSIMAFICTLSTWADLDSKATEHLTATKDLQAASDVVQKCSDRIRDIQSDGIVTQQEQQQIGTMEKQIEQEINSLSFYSHIVDIISEASKDDDVKELYKQINTIVKKTK